MHAASAVMMAERRGARFGRGPRGARAAGGGSGMQREGSGRDPSELIGAIADRRDRAAFAVLFGIFAGRIKSLAMRMGGSAESAEELAQETMLMVWRKAHYFDPDRASASAWIFSIARNLRIDRLRRDRRGRLSAVYELLEERDEDAERPDRAVDALERDNRVRAALSALTPDQVRVVQLSFFEDRAHAEIAGLLGIPLGTVKSRIRSALRRLRDCLEDMA